MENEYYFAWWNVENLFDINNSPNRPDWLQKRLKRELEGWNASQLNTKIKQLARVIAAMNDDKGPDLLGCCEVESLGVVEKLVSKLNLTHRDYRIVHDDTDDRRGIDVAFIYDKNKFDIEIDPSTGKERVFSHIIQKRSATRDIVQANFTTKSNSNFIVIGNHWPARLGGEMDSEPYRMMAGETLSYFLERILEIRGEIPTFVMGDFNDEPFNRSLTNYALSTSSISKVVSKRARNPYLYNFMWTVMDGHHGTCSYGGVWGMLDQLLTNRAGLHESGIYCKPEDIRIFTIPGMVKGDKVIRHYRPSKGREYNPQGFSDHLPVTLKVREKLG